MALRRRTWIWLGAAVLVVLAAVTLILFQPQKLFYDDRVDEALPSVAAEESADRHANQRKAGHPTRRADTKLAGIDPGPRSHAEPLHLVAVVADEDERGKAADCPALGFKANTG